MNCSETCRQKTFEHTIVLFRDETIVNKERVVDIEMMVRKTV